MKTLKSLSIALITAVLFTSNALLQAVWPEDALVPCIETLVGHTDYSVAPFCFSPDGQTFYSVSGDKTIKIRGLGANSCIQTLTGHTHSVYALRVSPDGQTLYSGSDDRTIKIWDLKTNSCIKTLIGHEDSVYALCVSPDGQTLYSGSGDKTIKIWDLKTNSCIKTLHGHTSSVRALRVSPDGQFLYSGSDDSTIKTWDLLNLMLPIWCKEYLRGHDPAMAAVLHPVISNIASTGVLNRTAPSADEPVAQELQQESWSTYLFSRCNIL